VSALCVGSQKSTVQCQIKGERLVLVCSSWRLNFVGQVISPMQGGLWSLCSAEHWTTKNQTWSRDARSIATVTRFFFFFFLQQWVGFASCLVRPHIFVGSCQRCKGQVWSAVLRKLGEELPQVGYRLQTVYESMDLGLMWKLELCSNSEFVVLGSTGESVICKRSRKSHREIYFSVIIISRECARRWW